MSNKSTYTPFSSSTRLDQPEYQLQQYTAAMLSARDRDRGRLSPEPHIEIMRPVSPFQSKRQYAHQQGQAQPAPAPAQAQQGQQQQDPQSYARILNPQYQATSSSSQPYAHARHARTQEANGSSMNSNSHSHSHPHPHTTSSSRPRPRGYKEDSRSARSQQRNADISPALKMMSYDHSPTPPSSNDGHGRTADPNASDHYSSAPEGHKRKNPSWRKPAPKYIPTPPSTPPTSTFERLPSSRDREEPIPPVPQQPSFTYVSPSVTSREYAHRVPVKTHTDPTPSGSASQPPPRPARAATEHQVPLMFRDFTANLEPSRARVPVPQQSTQSHTIPKIMNAISGPLKAATAQPTPPSLLRSQNSAVNQTQTPAATQTSPQPHTTLQVHPPPTLAAGRSTSTRTADARSEQQPQQQRGGVLVHPQPKKVPSMAQLVAMVLPSRTPSPAPPPTTLEISGPMPLITPAVAVQSQNSTLAPQATAPARSASTGLTPPAPSTESVPTSVVARSASPPCQVLLPPSLDSSAKSSRSASPQPSPPKVHAPLPVLVRSRSPAPAIIPQYAPPPPPFPPPPPNTPTVTPNQRISALLKQQTPSKLAEKATQEVESETKEKPAPTREQVPPSREQRMSAPPQQQVPTRLAEKSEAASAAEAQAAQVVEVKLRPATMHERPTHSRESGLVTPPITPPGTTATIVAMSEDHREVPLERPAATITRSRSPFPASSAPVAPAKAAARLEALIQHEQPRQTEERPVKEVNEVVRKVSPGSMHSTSVAQSASTNANVQDSTTPPLPADWKETITRAVHSATPSPPVPSKPQVEPEEIFNTRHFNKPTSHVQDKQDDPVPSYALTENWTDKVEHATTALELHVHEVEARRVNTIEVSDDVHLDGERECRHQASRPARRTPVVIEAPSAAAPVVEHQHRTALDLSPPINALNFAAVEVPARSRSPVPRRKAPQQFNAPTSLKQETIESRSANQPGAEISSGPTSLESPPTAPTSHPPDYSSHDHSSGPKRRGKLTRKRTDDDDAHAVPLDEAPIDIPNYAHYADTLVEKEPVTMHVEATIRPASPPPRYQALSTRKRLPRDGSDTGHAESGEKEALHERPSSPPALAPVRPLSPPPLPQTPPKRTAAHGQHKRLPAPEVTQQAYRPPTPPIPSHYRKKRSNDMLPSDAFASFMKPPVHVIYPDTSASHGQSLSGDSGFNVPNSTRTVNYNDRAQPAAASSSFQFRDEYGRPQSPSLSASASLERDEDEDAGVEPQAYPQVPPKTRRGDANARSPPTVSDRQSDYDFTVQQATRGQLRYPSAPMGQSKAHTLTLPPSANSSRSRTVEASERTQNTNMRARRTQQPHAKKAARSQSEKVLRNNNVQPVARSRSTPLPASSHRQRRGFWQAFGLWAKVFVSKFKTWASPAPSSSSTAGHARYYDEY